MRTASSRLTFATAAPHTAAETAPPPVVDAPSAFLDEKTFAARTVLIFGAITDVVAGETIRRLIALDAAGSEPIDVLVSSPGGHIESGDAIHDVIRFIDAKVNMIGTGWVGSAATHLYLSVPRERRYCLPFTRFLIHQPSGGMGGPASDIAIQARELVKARERIARTIAEATGQPLERVLDDVDRDYWMSADEAMDYGLVSRIIVRRATLRETPGS